MSHRRDSLVWLKIDRAGCSIRRQRAIYPVGTVREVLKKTVYDGIIGESVARACRWSAKCHIAAARIFTGGQAEAHAIEGVESTPNRWVNAKGKIRCEGLPAI